MPYIASPLEAVWMATDRTGKICATAALASQVDGWLRILSGAHDDGLLSRMPDGAAIEPLTGVARHPFANVGCRLPTTKTNTVLYVSEYNTSYIRVPSVCHVAPDARPRVKLFDMGCSVYGSRAHVRRASGHGPSLPLFEQWYESSCYAIDRMWGWEAKQMDAKKWWRRVSNETRKKLTFNNHPVTPREFEATLVRSTRPEDYVVVKLDIDTPFAENEIIDLVEKHAHLVDEFFYEYHFWFDGLDFGWGKNAYRRLRTTHNVTTAVRRMQQLRKKGIRAHFWV
jgi:hypothetical protein